jgi:membrane-associated phospholipid phosphatase
MPALVALSRMYRGEHHPTDVLGSLLFAALWVTTLTLLIKPGQHDRNRAGLAAGGGPHARPAATAPRWAGRRRKAGVTAGRE